MQEFLTISQLAHGFGVSEKVIRHAFKKLLKAGKLTEGEDYIREDYIDDLHFVWKIHPGKFAVHTKLFPAPSSVEPLGTQLEDLATTLDSKESDLGSQDVDRGSNLDSQHEELGSKVATTSAATRDEVAIASPVGGAHEREKPDYLDALFAAKDEQILTLKDHVAELRAQLAKKDEQMSHKDRLLEASRDDQNDARQLIRLFSERVVEMSKLQLPGGTRATHSGSQDADRGSQLDSQHDELGSNVGSKERATEKMWGTPPAGEGSARPTEDENFVDRSNWPAQ